MIKMYRVRDLIEILEKAPKDHYVVYCYDDQNHLEEYVGSYGIGEDNFGLSPLQDGSKVDAKTLLGLLVEMATTNTFFPDKNSDYFLDLVVIGDTQFDSNGKIIHLPVDDFKFMPV